jgi:hypothetical protein
MGIMKKKECFKCGEVKFLSDFYKHSQMKDGHVNKCKECNKSDVNKNRSKNIDFYRKYDRDRGNRQSKNHCPEYRAKYPNKYKAHTLVNSAIICKRLFKEPCIICGSKEKLHAHHDDYLKPLNVRWFCCAHHSQWHRDNGEAKNP